MGQLIVLIRKGNVEGGGKAVPEIMAGAALQRLVIMDCKKGVFTDTLLNIGNADDYTEWSYQTSSGVTVCLASSPSKCLIFADLKDSFVTVNVLAGTAEDSGNITPENLQELADSFDFSMLH